MKALIVVDYQFDFADPRGSLYVKGGNEIYNLILKKIIEYKNNNNLVIFTKDWHTSNHASFKQWPVHCVADTKGAKILFDESLADLIIKKGIYQNEDSYSAFYISGKTESYLNEFLKINIVKELEICGLALDVCVKETYIDAKKLHYNAKINLELSRAIDKNFKLEEM